MTAARTQPDVEPPVMITVSTWCQTINEARLVAIQAHGNQTYDGIFPYEKHLEDVVGVLERFHLNATKMICAGYLHDTMEDGGLSYNKIKTHFGYDVAEMVYRVTDELGRNRREKKNKTYQKIAASPDAILIKLADRIANVEHGGKIRMYSKEYPEFKAALQLWSNDADAQKMWARLDELLIKVHPDAT